MATPKPNRDRTRKQQSSRREEVLGAKLGRWLLMNRMTKEEAVPVVHAVALSGYDVLPARPEAAIST
jgi:hypothetical protein